jgi:hypothetical protein
MFTRLAALALQLPADPNQFAPIDQLPQTEQLPAAPLLVGAYMFIVVALIAYVWLVWRRVGKVETEVRALASRAVRGNGGDGGNG